MAKPLQIITDPRCTEYSQTGHPERPQRISGTVERLRAQTDLPLAWAQPEPAPEEALLRAHTPEHLRALANPASDFDADTPAYPKINEHARRSAGGGLMALAAAGKGERAFSLLRPPGHHATKNRAMGFCYLSSVAIAVLEARAKGIGKVAVFDFDVHHGNGTEAILLDQPGCAFFSVHQHPAYPGTGTQSVRNCHNYPMPPHSPREKYRAALEQAFADLKQFKPDLIGVSAGFDAYRRDPLCDEPLEKEDFYWLGEMIRKSGLPAFSVLEGGYSNDLPELILAYLKGWAGE